jgi:pimeloyl-ACP methyl ester carboxylesterase
MQRACLLLVAVIFIVGCSNNEVVEKNNVAKIRDTEIAYIQAGKGDTTLLFLHGWCINKEYWKNQIDHFSKRYMVVAIDLPGFGNSGKNLTDWSFENYASYINEFIIKQKLKNVIMIGHSMSGDLLLIADVQYPASVIGIVGIDNLQRPGAPMSEDQKLSNNVFFSMLEKNYTQTVTDFTRTALFPRNADSTALNRVTNDFVKSDSVIATKVLRALVDVTQQERDLMQQLSHKLYLINSDLSTTFIDSLQKYCKRSASVEYVKGTGHYPMIEKPEAFNEKLKNVIDSINRN